jgi:hypothetical protein
MLDDQRVRSNLKFPRPSSIPEECCPQELAALVEHALFDDLVRPRQHRLRDRQAEGAAVFRLITSSNLVGCSTGRSAGFAPLRILSM